LVNEGQSFKKGQLLATLKITEIDAQFSQAQMGYEKQKEITLEPIIYTKTA